MQASILLRILVSVLTSHVIFYFLLLVLGGDVERLARETEGKKIFLLYFLKCFSNGSALISQFNLQKKFGQH